MQVELDKDRHRHGGPYDRGSADAYYRRPFSPHFYVGNTYCTEKITKEHMTPEEIADYAEGFNQEDDRKDWGRDES